MGNITDVEIEKRGKFSIIQTKSGVWFVANSIGKCLDINNPYYAVRNRIDKKDWTKIKVPDRHGVLRDRIVINKNGLKVLLALSPLIDADKKEFIKSLKKILGNLSKVQRESLEPEPFYNTDNVITVHTKYTRNNINLNIHLVTIVELNKEFKRFLESKDGTRTYSGYSIGDILPPVQRIEGDFSTYNMELELEKLGVKPEEYRRLAENNVYKAKIETEAK